MRTILLSFRLKYCVYQNGHKKFFKRARCLVDKNDNNLPACNYAFPIDINREESVDDLKKKIKESKPNDLANIDSNNITLWQIDIPDERDDEISRFRGHKSAKKILATRKIGVYWSDTPAKRSTHVMVELPLASSPSSLSFQREVLHDSSLFYNHEEVDTLSVIPDERLERIYNWLLSNPIALVRSPPGSGKTTMGLRLTQYLQNTSLDARYYNMLRMFKDGNFDSDLFYSIWNRCKNDATTRHPVIVIVDESQILCDSVDTFWSDLKLFQQIGIGGASPHVLLLSGYDQKRSNEDCKMVVKPMCINAILGLSSLLLPKKEYDDLVERWIKKEISNNSHVNFSKTIRNLIFNITRGHAFLVRYFLRALQYEYKRRGYRNDNNMLLFLISMRFRNKIINTRPFDWTSHWSPTADELEFLRNAYYHAQSHDGSFSVDMVDDDTSRITAKYIRYGLITDTEEPFSGRLQFTTPYMISVLGERLFTVRPSLKYKCTTDFDKFIKRSIERMESSVLRDSFSRNNKELPLLERCWQMEWYRSATTVLRDANISPDVGSGFRADEFLDFYVNGSLHWGVELLREGMNMQDHLKRFLEIEAYENIPLKKWAIIDFRHHTKNPCKPQRGFWYAMYSDDFKTITIRRLNHPDITLTLRGE